MSDINYAICYFNPRKQFEFSSTLIAFGLFHFDQVLCINVLNDLISIAKRKHPDENLFIKEDLPKLAFNKIIDYVRISLCFECYFKALLLANGYIIHEIKSTSKCKTLQTSQLKKPISIKELKVIEEFKFNSETNSFTHEGLRNKTLKISTLFTEEYQRIIQAPGFILTPLKRVIQYRNNIHMLLQEKGEISIEYCNDLGNLKQYVEKVIVPNHKRIIKNISNLS